ncbi:MAG: DNA-binding protein [Epsilonproteobacteria bacterium]|nr:DNA-binding protein [Campylobacterota bacterium]
MLKMSITDAALKLGVSKEAIHNRIRRGSLDSVVEDGIKFVVLKKDSQALSKTQRRTSQKKVVEPDARYYRLLEEQNEKLQQKVDKLEGETKDLREQKEQMLIQERIRIEQIYKDKDEQLKNILNAISSKFMLNAPKDELVVNEEELLEVEVEQKDNKEIKNELISLNKYLKTTNFSNKKIQKIKARFKKVAKKDSRIVIVGKKYYIDLVKFDYSDLF